MAQGRSSSAFVPRRIFVAVSAAVLLGGATLAEPPSKKPLRSLLPRAKPQRATPARVVAGPKPTPRGVGTIQYDNDVPFSRDGSAPFVGNRFDVGVLPVELMGLSLE